MLSEKGYKELENATGIKGLQEIIEAKEVQEIEPLKTKHFSEVDYNVLYENLTKQGLTPEKYEEAKKAGEEMAVRDIKREFSLDFEGRSAKKLYEHLDGQIKMKSETDTSKIKEQYESDLEKLRNVVSEKEKEIAEIGLKRNSDRIDSFINSKFNNIDFEIPASITEEKQISDFLKAARDKEALYFRSALYDLDVENERIVAKNKQTGQIVKDELQNPMDVNLLADKYISSVANLKEVKKGRGASDFSPGKELLGINNENELIAYSEQKGIRPGTEEFDAIYAEWKK